MKMKHLKTRQELNEATENLNISDVSDSSLNTYQNAWNFLRDIDFKDKDICDYYTTDDGIHHNIGTNWKRLSNLLVKYADTLK